MAVYISDNDGKLIKVSGLYKNKSEILWTNPSPTSSFSQQTITLPNNDYDMFEFIYRYSDVNDFEKSDFIRATDGVRGLLNFTNTPDYIYARGLTINSKTSISFYASYFGSGSSETMMNTTIIPVYVIGHKTGLF